MITTCEATTRLATVEDAKAIAGLVRECYGDTYVSPLALDPAAVARSLVDGSVVYAVAEDSRGRHVGQAALVRLAEGHWECGRAIVVDDLRRSGIAAALCDLLLVSHAPRLGARLVSGRSVTSHLATQRYARSAGMVPIGLLLGYCPATLRPSGIESASQAVSFLVQAKSLDAGARERNLALEGRDLDRALAVLDSLAIPARRVRSRGPARPLWAHYERDTHCQVVSLRFDEDAPSRRLLPGFADGLEAAGTRVVFADVPAESPRAMATIDRLRSLGLGWAAYLPLAGARGEDVIRLQRYLEPSPLDRHEVRVIEEAVALRDDVLADRALPVALAS